VLSLCDTALYSTVRIDRVTTHIHSMHFLPSLDPQRGPALDCDLGS